MHSVHRTLWVLAALLAANGAALGADQTYSIKLNRPFKPGDAYQTHVVTQFNETTIGQFIAAPSRTATGSLKSDLQGRVDIQEVDEKGNEKTLTFTAESFTINGKDVLSRGDVIDVKRTDKDVLFSLRKGGELSQDMKRVLSQVYDKLNTSGVTDDDVFGSKTPRKIGESWKIDVDAAVKQATGTGVTFDAGSMKGESTLKGTETLAGEPMVRLDTTLSIKDLKPELPPTLQFERSQTDEQFSNVVPIDPKSSSIQSHAVIDIDIFLNPMGAASGGAVNIERKTHLEQTITNTPVKK